MFSRRQANLFLGELLHGAQPVYAGLFLGPDGLDANDRAAWREVAGAPSGYQRVGIGAGTPLAFGAPASGQAANVQDVWFPQAVLGWGTLTHWALLDAAEDGNVLAWEPFKDALGAPTAHIVYPGDVFHVLAGDLLVRLT